MAKLIQCNVPSRNIRKSRAFYQILFGQQDFARSLTDKVESYHQPISADGIQLTISPRQTENEQITCFFAVDNLEAILGTLEQNGGEVICEPFTLDISTDAFPGYGEQIKKFHPEVRSLQKNVGTCAIVRDPDGNLLGITELAEQAHWLFKYGAFSAKLDADQVAQHQRGIELAKLLNPIED
jgi:predicted enzyme related to lactoylglutathione lyase